MIEYLIGVDGGGTGTRVRLANADGAELAQARSGPSGLALGIDRAWSSINEAVAEAFATIGLSPPLASTAIGLGLAGVHNKLWASQFEQANPGYARLRLDNDGYTTLLGAHQGRPGVIIALGTGSVGQALLEDGAQREVGGWGFPSGDEASGGWIGLRAINHIQQVLDGRRPGSAFAQAIIDACGGSRDAIQVWLGSASQTSFAALAPIVIEHAASDSHARGFLQNAGEEVARMAGALDPSGMLPLALCGGLGAPLRPYLPATLRTGLPHGDAAAGALRMIAQHLREKNDARTA
ncbi:MAG: BadF/BadG/BcrA/BcrD ATPase family protein [Pseudomonadota bacterium]